MNAVTLADARGQLDALVHQVELGEAIAITQQGETVAWLTAAAKPREPIDLAQLRALTDSMPMAAVPASELIRSLRDDDRY